MSEHTFISVFAKELERYLAFKESMGCYGQSRIWYLRSTPSTAPHRSTPNRAATCRRTSSWPFWRAFDYADLDVANGPARKDFVAKVGITRRSA